MKAFAAVEFFFMLQTGLLFLLAFGSIARCAGSLEDFAGTWRYQPAQSDSSRLPWAPPGELAIVAEGGKVTCAACGAGGWTFTADGKSTRSGSGAVHNSIGTKWEGSALLINALVSGPAPYTVMDRWKVSRDRSTLTIDRVIQRGSHEAESKLVYVRDGAEPAGPEDGESSARTTGVTGVRKPDLAPPPAPEKKAEKTYQVARGTKIPLRILKGVSSKNAQEGDRVYLETTFPVLDQGRMVIPPGSQVAASVTYVKQAGRVKGRSELMLRFESLVLPNGVTRDFRSRTSSVEPGAGELDPEGKVKGPASKGEDARKVGEATATGAAVGSVVGAAAGRYGTGAAVGAAAGAAAGIGRVLGGRGQETGFHGGDVLEMVLDRTLVFQAEEVPKIP